MIIRHFSCFLSFAVCSVLLSFRNTTRLFGTSRDNICHIVEAPAEVSAKIKKSATDVAEKAIKSLEGAGVFAVELFLTEDDEVCWFTYLYFII